MSNVILGKTWKLWFPEELDIENKKEKKCMSDDMLLEDNKQKLSNHKTIKYKDNKQYYEKGFKEGYEIGYQKGVEKKSFELQQDTSSQDRIYKFIHDFELGLESFDTIIVSHLMQLALQVSKKIIGEVPIHNTILLKKIKKIIKMHPILSNKPNLRINPHDQMLIKKNFGGMLNFYGWNLIYDNNVSQGGCILDSDNLKLDATIPMFWKQLSESILLSENDS